MLNKQLVIYLRALVLYMQIDLQNTISEKNKKRYVYTDLTSYDSKISYLQRELAKLNTLIGEIEMVDKVKQLEGLK